MSLPATASIALGLVVSHGADFRPLEGAERLAFDGVIDDNPRIAFAGELAIVLDGSRVAFYDAAGNWKQFDLGLIAGEEVAA